MYNSKLISIAFPYLKINIISYAFYAFIAFVNSKNEEEKHIFLCLNLIASFAPVFSEKNISFTTFATLPAREVWGCACAWVCVLIIQQEMHS